MGKLVDDIRRRDAHMQTDRQRTPAICRRPVLAEDENRTRKVDLSAEGHEYQHEKVRNEPHPRWYQRVLGLKACLPGEE